MNTPLVTVIMPVYNAEKYLREAVDSILKQTYPHFEFFIFDDGSTDSSVEILRSYDDPRIQLFMDGQNLGQPKRYNAGIRAAKGKYIAIMHADDISLPHRFATQVKFLEENEEYALVGSRARIIQGDRKTWRLLGVKGRGDYLRIYQLFYCPIVHPTVMGKRDAFLDLLYNEDYITAEDYELWSRFLQKYLAINLPVSLLHYRVHGKSNQKGKKQQQLENITQTVTQLLDHSKIAYSKKDMTHHLMLSGSYDAPISKQELHHVEQWLKTIYNQLVLKNITEKKIIYTALSDNWISFCRRKVAAGFFVITYLIRSPFFYFSFLNLQQLGLLLLKYLLKKKSDSVGSSSLNSYNIQQ